MRYFCNLVHIVRFLSTPSVGRATLIIPLMGAFTRISIHALRGEGDMVASNEYENDPDFYPRPPWGGRPVFVRLARLYNNFYPRPPWGGRPALPADVCSMVEISIHALRGEGDGGDPPGAQAEVISIHALRGEGDSWLADIQAP